MTVWKDRLFLETNLKPITMETKHTKGEWTVKQNNLVYCDQEFIANACILTSRIDESLLEGESWLLMRERTELDRVKAEEERNANAKLIAASPELLYALIEAKIQINYLHEKFAETGSGNKVLRLIESAINKATL